MKLKEKYEKGASEGVPGSFGCLFFFGSAKPLGC